MGIGQFPSLFECYILSKNSYPPCRTILVFFLVCQAMYLNFLCVSFFSQGFRYLITRLLSRIWTIYLEMWYATSFFLTLGFGLLLIISLRNLMWTVQGWVIHHCMTKVNFIEIMKSGYVQSQCIREITYGLYQVWSLAQTVPSGQICDHCLLVNTALIYTL